ncbi:MAG: flagellar basal-body rod protein FlgG [Phycisphaerales bacterium JB043]
MAINALQSSASALSALSTGLDIIANNLANVNTQGFKSSRANFQDLLYIEKAQPGVENANGDQRPTGLYVGLGTKVAGTQLSFTQGAPQSTGNDLDLMIEGRGFFQVQVDAERAAGGLAYTRAGAFAKNADGDIVLASGDGRILEPQITIPDDAVKVEIMQSGEVWIQVNGENQPQQIGQLEIAGFVNPSGLEQVGENLFIETAASGPPITGVPGETGLGIIQQRFLEASNVDPTIELIGLIKTQRAFEMNSQSIRASDDILRNVAQLNR